MDEWMAMLESDRTAGVYQIPSSLDIPALSDFCQARNWQLFVIDGNHIANKAEFLNASAAALHFPDYFGQNWDAFEDCLTDLAWLPADGYVLVYQQPEHFADREPADWSTLMDILQAAIAEWQLENVPMYVLLQSTRPSLQGAIAL